MSDQDTRKSPYQTRDLEHAAPAAAPPSTTSSAALAPSPAPQAARRGNPNWRPGTSGNPSGRPKGAAGVAAYISSQTGGGVELVDKLLAIVRNDYGGTRDRLNAIHELLDRLVGKPLATTDLAVVTATAADLPPEFDGLSPAGQVAALRAMRQRALESSGS